MTREEKGQVIEELAGKFEATPNFYFADGSGMSVEKTDKFRRECYKRGFEYTTYLSTPQENTYILNSVTQSVDFGFLSLTASNIQVATYSLIGQYTSLYGKNPNSNYLAYKKNVIQIIMII
jgi:hypothetical protein